MDDSKWQSLPTRCGIENCRSRRFRRDPTDGLVYCKNGHQQPLALETQVDDAEEFEEGSQRKTTKRVRSNADAESDGTETRRGSRSRTLEGRLAAELFLECYQLVLRQQVWWLVKKRGLPAELEEVVRELWSVRLAVADAWLTKQLNEDVIASSNDLFSSQPSTPTATKFPNFEVPKLEDTLCLLYFSLILLRIPVTTRDIQSWTTDPGFTYINPAASLPHDALHRLPIEWRKRFYIRSSTPSPPHLHHRTIALSHQLFRPPLRTLPSIALPPLNTTLLLTRWLDALALPLPTFSATTSLADLLDLDFTFPQASSRSEISKHPELQLLALLVVAAKLGSPFDGVERTPASPGDPACLSVDWDVWNKLHAELPRAGKGGEGYWGTTPGDVVRMEEEEELDGYLDWFQETWLAGAEEEGKGRGSEFERDLFRLFPLDDVRGGVQDAKRLREDEDEEMEKEPIERRVRTINRKLIVKEAVGEIEAGDGKKEKRRKRKLMRPGKGYKRWKKVEDVEERAKVFVERCAWLAGCDLGSLVLAVGRIEKSICRWVERKRKERRYEDVSRDELSV